MFNLAMRTPIAKVATTVAVGTATVTLLPEANTAAGAAGVILTSVAVAGGLG